MLQFSRVFQQAPRAGVHTLQFSCWIHVFFVIKFGYTNSIVGSASR